MALLAILFMIVSIVGNAIIYQRANVDITGKSTATAQLSICLNRPPVLAIDCDDAGIGFQYSCDIDASDYDNTVTSGIQTLTFSDNSTLFDINPSTGLIQFTPNSSQGGNYTIIITVQDNSTCANSLDSDILNLTVREFYCGDGSCNGYETCTSCSQDCGECAEEEEAAASAGGGGGGGGGGAPGESAKGFHVNLYKIDSKILRSKEKEIIKISFDGVTAYELRIIEVKEDYMTAILKSTAQTFLLKLDETKEFDVNNDGLPDISIKLVKIQEKDIWLFLERMEGANILLKIKKEIIVIEPKIVRISFKLRESIEKPLTLTNIGLDTLDINIEVEGLDNIVKIKEDSFSLEAFQMKTINAVYDATQENLEPGVYNGKITFTSKNIREEVLVIVAIETKRVIFDVKVYIPSEYKRVSPGQAISANIDLYNLEDVGRVKVNLIYQIRDTKGNIIVNEEETITTGVDVSFTKKLALPANIEQGEYIFIVIAKYADSVGTASDVFEVRVKELFAPLDYSTILALIIIILIIMGIIFGVLVRREHRLRTPPAHLEKIRRRKELARKKRRLLSSIKDEIKGMKKEKIDVKDEESILKKF